MMIANGGALINIKMTASPNLNIAIIYWTYTIEKLLQCSTVIFLGILQRIMLPFKKIISILCCKLTSSRFSSQFILSLYHLKILDFKHFAYNMLDF